MSAEPKPIAVGRALRDIKAGEVFEIHVGPEGYWMCDAIAFFPMSHAILLSGIEVLQRELGGDPQPPKSQ